METVLHYIKKYAETQPDTLAVCELKKHLTYAEYWTAIRKMANVLLQNGIKKNAHVILRCTQNIEYMVLFSALQYMQALVIPVERSTSPERMQEIRDKVDAEWLISNKESDGLRWLSPKKLNKGFADSLISCGQKRKMQIHVRCCCSQRVRPAAQRVLSCIIRMMWQLLGML